MCHHHHTCHPPLPHPHQSLATSSHTHPHLECTRASSTGTTARRSELGRHPRRQLKRLAYSAYCRQRSGWWLLPLETFCVLIRLARDLCALLDPSSCFPFTWTTPMWPTDTDESRQICLRGTVWPGSSVPVGYIGVGHVERESSEHRSSRGMVDICYYPPRSRSYVPTY